MARFWVPIRERVQTELIKRGHCAGCSRSLADAERELYHESDQKELVICKCRRVYVYDKLINHYRRAEERELQKT